MFKPRSYPIPLADYALYSKDELQRAEASLTTHQMTAEERERYGPPNLYPGKGRPSFAPRRKP